MHRDLTEVQARLPDHFALSTRIIGKDHGLPVFKRVYEVLATLLAGGRQEEAKKHFLRWSEEGEVRRALLEQLDEAEMLYRKVGDEERANLMVAEKSKLRGE